LELLISYDWPGNVRELENVIDRAVLLETSGRLQANSLPPEIRSTRKRTYVPISEDEDIGETEILTLDEIEKRAIERALRATDKNIRQTARLLGINRATVYRKLEKYKLLAGR